MRDRKMLCALVLVLALGSFDVRVGYAAHVEGVFINSHDDITYVRSSDGRPLARLRVGERLTVEGKEPVEIRTHFWGLGWHRHPVEPKPYVRVSLKKWWAVKPEGEALLMAAALAGHRRRAMLNYPPVSSVWHVPLGVSWLTAALRTQGHDVVQNYGHIEGLEYVLKQRDQSGGMIDRALKAVRDPQSQVHDWYFARTAFEAISRAVPTDDTFVVERNNVRFVSRHNDGTIERALAAIQERERHLWYEYFVNIEVPRALNFQPHVYGVSVADERQLIQGLILASLIKDALPETLVVLGGNFWARVTGAFRVPAFAGFFNHVDAIVYREGFKPFTELAETLDPSRASGTVWRRGEEVVVNPPTSEPIDFNVLPTTAFDGGVLQWSPDIVRPIYDMSNCPRACGFCAIAAGSDTFLSRLRSMSPRRIVEHMTTLGTHRFDIVDELFPVGRQLAVGRELKRVGYHAEWQCYLTATNDLLDEETCWKLYEAGCRSVQMGLETLSSETLQREKKTWNTPQNYGRILENLKRAGIQTHVFLLIGIPGEPLTENLRWLPFLEDYGDAILTIKCGRYRLARQSPEEQQGLHSEFIEVLPDTKPLHLNRDFRYRKVSNHRIDAMRDILEQACRRHWAYGVTSTIPWWINRGRYSWEEMRQMARALPSEEEVSHLRDRITRARGIVRSELGREAPFRSFNELARFARTM